MTVDHGEYIVDFEDPPKLFLVEDRLKAVLGEPLLYRRFYKKQGGFRGDERVLDFGCGGGVGTRCIAKQLTGGGEAVGVDVSSVMLERARKRLEEYPNAKVLKGELDALDIEGDSFDIASMIYVIHDIARKDRPRTVRALARLLKPGGKIWVFEPTKDSHGIPVEELRQLMADAGLHEIASEVGRSSYRGTFEKR